VFICFISVSISFLYAFSSNIFAIIFFSRFSHYYVDFFINLNKLEQNKNNNIFILNIIIVYQLFK
jgi:hypothetical protein